jgi:hypothetical protein
MSTRRDCRCQRKLRRCRQALQTLKKSISQPVSPPVTVSQCQCNISIPSSSPIPATALLNDQPVTGNLNINMNLSSANPTSSSVLLTFPFNHGQQEVEFNANPITSSVISCESPFIAASGFGTLFLPVFVSNAPFDMLVGNMRFAFSILTTEIFFCITVSNAIFQASFINC